MSHAYRLRRSIGRLNRGSDRKWASPGAVVTRPVGPGALPRTLWRIVLGTALLAGVTVGIVLHATSASGEGTWSGPTALAVSGVPQSISCASPSFLYGCR